MDQSNKSRSHGHGARGKGDAGPDVQISKNLSWLLRHGAIKEGLNMRKDGFVKLDEILAKDFYKARKIGYDKIKEIVDTNDKKRFVLQSEVNADGKSEFWIRASQGHTIKVRKSEK